MAQLHWTESSARRHFEEGREIQLLGQPDKTFDGTTSYGRDYPAHAIPARPPPAPAYMGQSLPFEGMSSYTADFQPHQLPERNAPVTYFQPQAIPFEGTTTYGSNYVPHQIEKRAPPPSDFSPSPLPFEGVSSYRSDYPGHPAQPQRLAAPQFAPQQMPFEGISSYKGDYVAHPLESRPPPGPAYAQPSLPFEGSTTYGENFRPYPIQPREGGAPVEYHGSGAKFEGTSESHDAFKAWALDPVRAAAPPPMQASLPFDGTTTHREMFKGWQLPPRRPALGVQLVGNVAFVLIPANAPIPACGRQVFTTVHDGQTEMDVLILEGAELTQASQCNVLAQLTMTGIAPAPRGVAKLEVVIHVSSEGVMNVTACDLDSKRQEQWLKEGYLTAHV